jgi:hypothetical protein
MNKFSKYTELKVVFNIDATRFFYGANPYNLNKAKRFSGMVLLKALGLGLFFKGRVAEWLKVLVC